MHILVDRVAHDDDSTLSVISIDDNFECFGCEDEPREEKLAGETRIPAGIYDVEMRTVGGFNARYSKKFPALHRGMLHVIGVPGFEYILIHIGNKQEHTDGCLLVGAGANTISEYSVTSSAVAYIKLYSKVLSAAEAGELTIEYRDSDKLAA